jgi:hypothetical protein
MTLVICPGIHPVHLMTEFRMGVGRSPKDSLIFPADRLPVYSPYHIGIVLQEAFADPATADALTFLAFSAGAVGAIGAARHWVRQGGTVNAFLAFDAWGVALHDAFPVYRFSHDYFTYWSSGLLGQGLRNFYADPPVGHLDLWRSPQSTAGYVTAPHADEALQRCTAATAIAAILAQFKE